MCEFTYSLKHIEKELGRPLTSDEKEYAIFMMKVMCKFIDDFIVEEVMKLDKDGNRDLCGVR